MPTARLLRLQLAVPGLPTVSVAVAQPMGLPPSVKVTLPLGALPVTAAVRVSVVPATAGVPDVDSTVVVAVGAAVTRTKRTASAAAWPLTLLT